MDTIPISSKGLTVNPQDYLRDKNLLAELNQTRDQIFSDPRSRIGKKSTYAFDLYVNTGYAYKKLRANHYEKMKSLLISKDLDWYFLSGGYGIIHALEPALKYQATFNRNISYKNNIPFTANLWKESVPKIIDNLISEKKPDRFYTFGSQDYTRFVKETQFWKTLEKEQNGIKMFESTGSAGVHWISKILNELAYCIETDDVASFDRKYPQFLKQ